MKKLFGYVIIALTALSLGGCATTRSTVMPTVAKAAVPANPTEGPAVKIVAVSDQRVFELKPRSPSSPSLGSETELANTAITSRAIGRKRGGFGMALGDVLLPEGTTVASMIQEAVTNAYRESGYRVLGKDDAGFDAAVPVDVKVKQFWCWDTPGFWQMSLENRMEVLITAPQPGFENGATVNGYAINHLMAVFEDEWPKIASASLADFNKNLKAKLKQK
jgi:uncharacterized lipoprotein YajG